MLLLLLQITVYESLIYSARLRFNRDVEQEIVYAFVQEVRAQHTAAAHDCLLSAIG